MEITKNSTLEETLNAFIADEHIASTQYKMAKVVAKGKALDFSNKIFDENGDEEDEHFDELVTYAQSLNIPVQVNPSQMEINCTTPFVDMTDGDSTAQLVSILISAEKKAISGYETALRNSSITSEHPELIQFFGELLNDERGHLKELEDVMSSIEGSSVEQTSQPNVVDVTPPVQTDEYGYEISQDANTFGESVDRTNTIKILESVKNGDIDSNSLVKNLVGYMLEESVAKFIDKNDYFDTETVRLAANSSENCCSNALVEMVEDGILESTQVAADMLDFMSDSEVKEFGESVGYLKSETQHSIDCGSQSFIGESVMSFEDIFNKAIAK